MTEFRGAGNVTWIIIITWQFSHKHKNTTLQSTLMKREPSNLTGLLIPIARLQHLLPLCLLTEQERG